MSDPNSLSASISRNDNAEWAILKGLAAIDDMSLSWSTEFERSESERAKYRERGKKLLRLINRFPDRLSASEKAAKLDQVHRIAEGVGIGEDLQDAIEKGYRQAFGEAVGRATFGENEDLTEQELGEVERLRTKVIDLTEVEPRALAEAFPSGNFLFHGSTVGKIEKIFQTGGLKNGVALAEDDPKISAQDLNSGLEGISWSLNQIDALPGTRGHIAGFLAAPEDILETDEKLVVPSRPAPYEVLQVSEKLDPEQAYYWKNQAETWGDSSAPFSERNNVDSNLMWMRSYKPGSRTLRSSVYEYTGSMEPDYLRQFFKFDDKRHIVWDADLYQKNEVPQALPYLQSILDRNMLKQRSEYQDIDTMEKVLERTHTDPNFLMTLILTVRAEGKPANEAYEQILDQAVEPVRIRPEEMYFVTSHRDLEAWLKVMVRTGVEPKGILLYDDAQVVMENFASDYEGNHEELSAELGRAVGVREDFWQSEMGMDPAKMSRSGSVGQVLLESEVKRDKVLRMRDGELVVE